MKKGLVAQERGRAEIRLARHDGIVRRPPFMRERAHRPVFLDEPSVKANMTRLRGRNAVGERLFGTTPFGRWKTRTFIAGLTCDALIAPWVIEGAMDGPLSTSTPRPSLHRPCRQAPCSSGFDPLDQSSSLLDNLSTHSPKAAEILNVQGCWMPFLPACSPDPNPIEMAFSRLKAPLRRIGARTCDTLVRALGDLCGLFDPKECRTFFKAAGYASC